MQNSPRSLVTLMMRDGAMRGIAFALLILGLTGAAVLWTILWLLGVSDGWVKIVLLPLLLLIPGLVLGLFLRHDRIALCASGWRSSAASPITE